MSPCVVTIKVGNTRLPVALRPLPGYIHETSLRGLHPKNQRPDYLPQRVSSRSLHNRPRLLHSRPKSSRQEPWLAVIVPNKLIVTLKHVSLPVPSLIKASP